MPAQLEFHSKTVCQGSSLLDPDRSDALHHPHMLQGPAQFLTSHPGD